VSVALSPWEYRTIPLEVAWAQLRTAWRWLTDDATSILRPRVPSPLHRHESPGAIRLRPGHERLRVAAPVDDHHRLRRLPAVHAEVVV